jgi:hypothetical protein
MPPVLFALVIFEKQSLIYALVSLGHNPPIYTYYIVGMTGTHHHVQHVIDQDGGSHSLFAQDGLEP